MLDVTCECIIVATLTRIWSFLVTDFALFGHRAGTGGQSIDLHLIISFHDGDFFYAFDFHLVGGAVC